MSETNGSNSFQTPAEENFNTMTFQGSIQQVLSENIGSYVIIDFFMGTSVLETRQGFLHSVASQYVVLYDELNLHYVVCDIFSIKFVTFLLPNYRPGQVPTAMTQPAENGSPAENSGAATASAYVSPAQAAYTYATRRRGVTPRSDASARPRQ